MEIQKNVLNDVANNHNIILHILTDVSPIIVLLAKPASPSLISVLCNQIRFLLFFLQQFPILRHKIIVPPPHEFQFHFAYNMKISKI